MVCFLCRLGYQRVAEEGFWLATLGGQLMKSTEG